MYCHTCQQDYRTKTHDCPFLAFPEPISSRPIHTYDYYLKRTAKRFKSYQKYTGHGKDYYNLQGMATLRNQMKGK